MMKKRKIDLLNILKYGMVVVFIVYIVFLLSREGGNEVPVKTISKNILAVAKTEGMKKGTTQDLKKYYRLNASDYDGVMLYIPDDVMSVNEILVVKLKDKSQAEAVEGYGAKQTKLINSAVLDSRGYYLLMAVSEDADSIYRAFKKSM